MDVDIGSSAVANGVLGLVFGVVTTLVVDMAFLIQVLVRNSLITYLFNFLPAEQRSDDLLYI